MMRPEDRAKALDIASLLDKAAVEYGCRGGDLCKPTFCRGTLLNDGADTIRSLVRHVNALTPMARAWATGEQTTLSYGRPGQHTTASGTAHVVMDPALDFNERLTAERDWFAAANGRQAARIEELDTLVRELLAELPDDVLLPTWEERIHSALRPPWPKT